MSLNDDGLVMQVSKTCSVQSLQTQLSQLWPFASLIRQELSLAWLPLVPPPLLCFRVGVLANDTNSVFFFRFVVIPLSAKVFTLESRSYAILFEKWQYRLEEIESCRSNFRKGLMMNRSKILLVQ